MSTHGQYRGILFLLRYDGICVLVRKLCSAADAVRSGNWPILCKILTLSVAICTVLLHLSNFCLCSSSATDFFNIGVRTPTSSERASCLPVRRTIRFEHIVWVGVMVISRWLYFYLTNRHLPYVWIAVVSRLNYLTLAVDLRGSSAQYQVKPAVDPSVILITKWLEMEDYYFLHWLSTVERS